MAIETVQKKNPCLIIIHTFKVLEYSRSIALKMKTIFYKYLLSAYYEERQMLNVNFKNSPIFKGLWL